MTKHVAVLKGGVSNEREVSLHSGAECAKALRNAGYRVTEAPVTVRYHGRGTSKMRLKDGWRILRPLVYLRLGLRH
jgi:D-alanine-D-alanine ligase-like ATP-grasp enzyme